MTRQYDLLDSVLSQVDATLRTVFAPKNRAGTRVSPANSLQEAQLSLTEKQHVAGLMRVNHAGEVCAQALYQGQAVTAKQVAIKQQMQTAAEEEIDHLAWCETRLNELDSRPSLLNPLWYTGSFLIGMLAGLAGDRWSLGFVAETERQVSLHLEKHLQKIPEQDGKTCAILKKMNEDETRHAESAMAAGAAELPLLIKMLMNGVSMLLTRGSYYI
jgi:ubiquinone biosynthesis monooxygenase Coq7